MVKKISSLKTEHVLFTVIGLIIIGTILWYLVSVTPHRDGMTSSIKKTSDQTYKAPGGDTVYLSGDGQMNSPSYTETYSSLQPYMSSWNDTLQEGMTSNRKKTYPVQYNTGSYIGPAGDTVYISGTTPTSAPVTPPVQPSANNTITQSFDPDLYMLKSQVVPPICPACPTMSSCPRSEVPPPCPPCARCPEPAFDCKKVPNYRSSDSSFLPMPVLSDFSSFGM